jgi:hypothetical protein
VRRAPIGLAFGDYLAERAAERREGEQLAERLMTISRQIEACGVRDGVQVRDARAANPLEGIGVRRGQITTISVERARSLYASELALTEE